MIARASAEAVLLLHFAFVLFAVGGGFLVLFASGIMWLHLPVVLWSSFVNLAGRTCPLTPIEKHFRQRAGGVTYDGGFVAHYIGPLVYPGGMPRRLEVTAGISIVVWNAIVYAIVFMFVR